MNSLNSIILSLAIAYAVLGVLLLVACLFTHLPWPVKAGAIVVTSAFYLVSFFATHSLLGWSTDDPLPPNFKLLGARIVEPHSVGDDPGSIYLWVEAYDHDNFPSGVPRAYRLPYSAKLADKTEADSRTRCQGTCTSGSAPPRKARVPPTFPAYRNSVPGGPINPPLNAISPPKVTAFLATNSEARHPPL